MAGGPTLIDTEFERRLPVWTALAELFLDTEHDDADYAMIARTLRTSGYTAAELRTILDEDVVPRFGSNLISVAGEWAPWSIEDVRHIMRGWRPGIRASAPQRWLRRWAFGSGLDAQWAAIERHLQG